LIGGRCPDTPLGKRKTRKFLGDLPVEVVIEVAEPHGRRERIVHIARKDHDIKIGTKAQEH
jgi:hypothetical protein